MTMHGLNLPADGRLSPEFAIAHNAAWVRVVLKPDYDISSWLRAARDLGIETLGVIARESLVQPPSAMPPPGPRLTWRDYLESIRRGPAMVPPAGLTPSDFRPTTDMYA